MAAKRCTVDVPGVGTGASFRIRFDPTDAFGPVRPPVELVERVREGRPLR